jgi:zinc protease
LRQQCRRAYFFIALICGVLAPAIVLAQEVLKREGVWAQDYAGRPADPAVRFGRLANGLRYAIRKNATPALNVSLRLVIGSGSLDEHDDQQGLAHFLEHMAFKGSTHVPAGEMVRMLQRLGLQFGPDTNAHTGQEETVYDLNLPHNDEETTGTALMLLREIAGELTLSQAEMDPERGVVLSEERLRDGPGYQAAVGAQAFQLQGQLAARRLPIGKKDIIQNAPVALMRAFYEAEYRPDNATIVAAGDFDVDRIEAGIRAAFDGWVAKVATHARPDLGEVQPRGATASVLSGPGLPLILTASWVGRYDATADTLARGRRDVAEMIAMAVLNRRLDRLAQGADAPFLSASIGRGNVARSAKVTRLTVQPKRGAWIAGLEGIIGEQRRIVEFGVRQDEIDREVAETRASMRNAASSADTRGTAAIANAIVRAAIDDEVFSSPAQDLADMDAFLAELTRADVDAAVHTVFSGSGPLVFLASPDPVAGGEDDVKAALAAAQARPIAMTVAAAEKSWPYGNFGAAGQVASSSRIADLDVTAVTFANGVRLLIKPTDFARNQILVGVRVGTGRVGIGAERAHATWMVNGIVPLLRLNGTRDLAYEDIQTITAARRVGIGLSLEDDAFKLTGVTQPADLDLQLQLLTAYTTRPGMRPLVFERIKGTVASRLNQIDATAVGVFGREAGPALHGGEQRWQSYPTADAIAASIPDDLPLLIGADFADGPLEVTVVGDVTPERAIDAVARSYGTLPHRPDRGARTRAVGGVRFPPGNAQPYLVLHHGRADQAVTMQAWPTSNFYADPQHQWVLGVMGAILLSRLTDRLRVTEGVTYSPTVTTVSSNVFDGFGYIEAFVETPLDKAGNFTTELQRIVASMQAEIPSDDELERAKRPRVEQRIKTQQTNAYWLAALSAAHADARAFDAIRQLVTGTEQVTADDVRNAARTYLREDTAFRMLVRSAAAP